MLKMSQVLRVVSLAILFGGSAMIVFAAITLVKAAEADGVTVSEAAARNAPLFINYSKVALATACVLLFSEFTDAYLNKTKTVLMKARYVSSAICFAAMIIFGLVLVPPLAELQPKMKTDPAAHEEFKKFHETSRGVFGIAILSALVSLVLPVLESAAEAKLETKAS